MYIEPNTTIQFMRGVPLDPSNDHQVIFNSINDQSDAFSLKIKPGMSFTHQYYQRVNRNTLRVHTSAYNLYDCNYLRFRNESHGNKWFYAFVTQVDYINESVTEVTYQLDIFQTWMFNFNLQQCFVERQHQETDNIGDNLQGEPILTGEYELSSYYRIQHDMNDCLIVAGFIPITLLSSNHGQLVDGVFSGLKLLAFERDDGATSRGGIRDLNALINSLALKPDNMVYMFLCPRTMLESRLNIVDYDDSIRCYEISSSMKGLTGTTDKNYKGEFFTLRGTEDFGKINDVSFVPKNKKLYTYPFNYFGVMTPDGNEMKLRYEFFTELKPVLRLESSVNLPVKVSVRPTNYKGAKSDSVGETMSTGFVGQQLLLQGYPMCSWRSDTFLAWVAQSALPTVTNLASNLLGNKLAANLQTNLINNRPENQAFQNGIPSSMVGNQLDKYRADTKAVQMQKEIADKQVALRTATSVAMGANNALISNGVSDGVVDNGNVNVSNGSQQIFTYRAHCMPERARSIDDFFTMFGYAQNRILVPNMKARPHWTYIKTTNCEANGNMPADDIEAIKSLFNNGITIWRNIDEVGDYTLDNSPV